MRVPRTGRRFSRGTTIAMTAVLAPVLVGFTALSVDLGVRATAQAQLGTAADAAALAGAAALVTERRFSLTPITDASPEIAAAQARAAVVAGNDANRVLGDHPVIHGNTANASSGDVVVGSSTRSGGSFQWHDPPLSDPNSVNSVKVTLGRDADHGNPVPSFFGTTNAGLYASSTATVQMYAISGVKSVDGQNISMLPIVLDQATYKIMTGQDTTQQPTDQYTYSSSGGVRGGGDGIPESVIYPISAGLPGNWGTIKIGVSNNSTSTLGSQIRDGITPAQLSAEFASGVAGLDQVDSSTGAAYHTFGGDPGISAGIKDDLESIIGKPVILPIYDQSGGVGDNTTYRVNALIGARILAVNFQGNPKYVVVQPAPVSGPSYVGNHGAPVSFSQGGVIELRLTR